MQEMVIAITHIGLLTFLYGLIWFAPATINYNRRKRGQAPYWLLFCITLVVGIAIVYVSLFLLSDFNQEILVSYFPPMVASISAGLFYFYIAKALDEKRK
jgi:hypothetical protein